MRLAREADIQRAVLDLLAAKHIFAFRLNTAAFAGEYKGKKRFFKSHSLGPGAADILAILTLNDGEDNFKPCNDPECWCAYQEVLWVECKKPGGSLSLAQLAFANNVRALGHKWLQADSVDVVADWLKERGL